MLSAISSQNCSSVNFCARGSVRESRVINGLLREFTKYTNAAAREYGIGLFDASNMPSQAASRIRHLYHSLKNRRPCVGKMKYSA